MQIFNCLCHHILLCFLRNYRRLGNASQITKRNVLPDTLVKHQTFCLSVLCDKSDSLFHCLSRIGDLHFFAVNLNASAFIRKISKDCLHDFCSSGPHQTGNSKYFACTYGERYIMECSFSGQSFYFQNFFADFYISGRITFSNLTSDSSS